MSDKYDSQLKNNPYFRLFGFFAPGPQFPAPIIMGWVKKYDKKNKNIPSRTMSLYFQNYVYQIFLPFCKADEKINEKGKAVGITTLLNESPKGKRIRILG